MTAIENKAKRRRPVAPTHSQAELDASVALRLLSMAVVLATTAIAFLPHSNWWWGFNLLHFYPVPFRVGFGLGIAALIGVTWLFKWRAARKEASTGAKHAPINIPAPVWALAAAIAAGAAFFFFRARSFLLGDGTHIVIHLARNEPPAPRAVLYNLLETWLVGLLKGDRRAPTLFEAGFLSIVVGVLTVAVSAWLLARRGREPGRRVSTVAVALLVFLQPATQLFFGYVEAYALLAGPLILFFLLAQEAAEGRRSPWIAGIPLVICVMAHPFGMTAAPAFLLLMTGRKPGKALNLRLIGLFAGGAVLLEMILFIIFHFWTAGRDPLSPLRFVAPQEQFDLIRNVLRNILITPHWSRRYHLYSTPYLTDVVNHLWLTAAPALLVLASLAMSHGGRTALRSPPSALAAAGTAFAIAIRLMLRTVLGAVRDWDLFAATGIGLTAVACAATAVFLDGRRPSEASAQSGQEPRNLQLALVCGLVSLFFLIPWIGLQFDIERATRRHFAVVDGKPELEPISAGDFHAATGDRLYYIGQSGLAGRAFERAYRLWPSYMHALKGGQAYLASGEYARAARAMERALGHVPNDRTAMASLGNIFNWMNEYDRADSVLRKTIELYPTMPLARMHLAQTLAMTGRFADAREMLESARRLMKPDDPSRGTFARLDSLIATRAPGPGTLAPSSRNPDLGESLPPPR